MFNYHLNDCFRRYSYARPTLSCSVVSVSGGGLIIIIIIIVIIILILGGARGGTGKNTRTIHAPSSKLLGRQGQAGTREGGCCFEKQRPFHFIRHLECCHVHKFRNPVLSPFYFIFGGAGGGRRSSFRCSAQCGGNLFGCLGLCFFKHLFKPGASS